MSDEMAYDKVLDNERRWRQWDKQRKQERAHLWASLTPQERAPLEAYLAYLADLPDSDLQPSWLRKPSHRKFLHANFLIALEEGAANREEAGRQWLAERQADDRAREAVRAEAEAEKKRRADYWAARRIEIDAAIARGEPVPAHLRPVGNRCANCGRALRDLESVRLGVGPECRRRTPAQKDAA